jgi:hypothetical protein
MEKCFLFTYYYYPSEVVPMQILSSSDDIRTPKLWRLLFPRLSLAYGVSVQRSHLCPSFLFCNIKKVSCQASGELAYEFGEHLIFVNNTLRRRCTLCLEKGPF